ncbi:hypothetical protein JG688_00005158 [Phytophthora aleatoria]|uniref:Poly(A) RNA polymerase mitochondrial-like central palm domain-containing protein n=1 Tax=Phytophthora aleatoria TaxID=2496075 RepID=A0A8J5J026_9STRA|nr:hypothetical protein JG688_00005158 [Phytophthora aleatoria]
MSHGAMPDAAAHVKDEDKPRKNHSGPRKRRPKKKPSSRAPNAPTTPERHTNAIASTHNDTPESTGLCAAAASFTPPSKSAHSLVTPPLAPVLAPETEIHFNPLNPAGSGSYSRPQASRPATSRLFRHPELSPEERAVIRGEQEQQAAERAYWTQWVIEAAEKERARRLNVLKQLQCEEEEEIRRRRQWAIATIEKEQEAMMREMFLDNMKNTQWFQSTISRFSEDYEVILPDTLDQVVEDTTTDFYSYDVVCPNAVLGCKEICSRENLAEHLANCPVNGMSREKEWEERLEWRRSVIQASEKERERRIDEERAEGGAHGTGLSFGNLQRLYEEQTAVMQVVLHDEIVDFYNHHRREARDKRLWMQKAIGMVTEEIELLWNHCVQVEGYGSFATRLHGESSDVDLVVFGATEEFNFTSQQCVEALADHVRELSAYVDVSAITRASIPLLKVVVLVTIDGVELRIPFDITFDEPHGIHHNGVASVTLVQGLASAFYGLRELTLVLKHFLVERGLNDPYVGGLSSYGLLLMVVYVLQEQGALISMVDGQKLVHDAEDDLDEMKPVASTRWHPRYEAQCLKGELIAKEIVKQCSAKQQPKKNEMKKHKKKAKRAVLPSFVTGLEEHETKPYLLGKLLMDFLQFYGNDFRQNLDQVSVVSWGEPTMLSVDTSPLPDNNVGKSCYRVSQVFRDFSDFLSFLTALIVRGSVMTTGKKKGDTNGHNEDKRETRELGLA